MKKKLVATVLATLMMTISLTGCGSYILNIEKVINSPDSSLVDFEVVDNNFYGTILVDKNTKVMYYWIGCDSGGITPIYNEDGTLKLYEEK